MEIQEEIFEEFFRKLEEDENFPDPIIEELKKLWERGKIASQEAISEAIRVGCKDVSEDQES